METVLLILAVVIAVVIIYFAISKSDNEESTESDPVQVETPKRTTSKPPKSFSKMTKKELLAYAEENGIDANSRDTKAEIVKKIKSEGISLGTRMIL